MRSLYIFPILHKVNELGSIGPLYKKIFIKEKGLTEWKRRQAFIGHIWDRIERKITRMRFNYQKLRIYQDGLSTEVDIDIMLKEMLEKGSRNYILINKMIIRGARLMGTENSALLLEEYKCLKNNNKSPFLDEKNLLSKRDEFIAQRINATLNSDGVGILFIGANHNVMKFLPNDIKATTINNIRTAPRIFGVASA